MGNPGESGTGPVIEKFGGYIFWNNFSSYLLVLSTGFRKNLFLPADRQIA